MPRPVGRLFVLGLLGFGVLVGVLAARAPELRDLPVPPFAWPLALAFVVDLALMPLAREGRIAPLTMNERAIGVIGAGLIITVILAASGA